MIPSLRYLGGNHLSIFVLLTSFYLFSKNSLISQEANDYKPAQIVYVELLGAGGVYSINYDRRLFNSLDRDGLGIRVGIGFFSPVWTFPAEVNYLLGRRHYLDMGLGVVYATGSIDVADGPTFKDNSSFYLSVKYRFQALNNGLFFSIGGFYFPAFKFFDDPVSFWPGLALGIKF